MNKKRKHQITFRLNDEEQSSLRMKIASSGCNQQEYLRRVALGKEVLNTEGIKTILPEMKRQGNNLNQIAKKLNQGQYVDYNEEFSPTMKEVGATWQSLRQSLRTLQLEMQSTMLQNGKKQKKN